MANDSAANVFATLGALGAGALLLYKLFSGPSATDEVQPEDHSDYSKSTSAGQRKGYNATDNRANQCNPNHQPTGPGHSAYYSGSGTKADLDNHANQLNPNNSNYGGGWS